MGSDGIRNSTPKPVPFAIGVSLLLLGLVWMVRGADGCQTEGCLALAVLFVALPMALVALYKRFQKNEDSEDFFRTSTPSVAQKEDRSQPQVGSQGQGTATDDASQLEGMAADCPWLKGASSGPAPAPAEIEITWQWDGGDPMAPPKAPAPIQKPKIPAFGTWSGVDYGESYRVNAYLNIEYVDANGNTSSRRVMVNSFDSNYMQGFCESRQAHRTFVFDRIQSAVDIQTGEVIDDVKAYLVEVYKNSDIGVYESTVKRYSHHINVLLFVAKADGRMLKPERMVIAEFIAERAARYLSPEFIEGQVKGLGSLVDGAFRSSLKQLRQESPEDLPQILELAKRIVGTQKAVDPMEEAVLKLIQDA